MNAPASACLSISIHAAVLAALVFADASPPGAPPLSGGWSGGAGPSFRVAIRHPVVAAPREEARTFQFGPRTPAPLPAEDPAAARLAAPPPWGGDGATGAAAAIRPEPRSFDRESIDLVDAAAPGGRTPGGRIGGDPPPPPLGPPGFSDSGSDSPAVDGPDALRPVYPSRCLELRHEGTARVSFIVGADGATSGLAVTQSAGCPDLDAAAMKAVRNARFRPARRFGIAVSILVEQPFRFEIRR